MKRIHNVFSKLISSPIRKFEDSLIREKLKYQVHCIENSEAGIVFIKDSISIYSCSKSLKNCLLSFLKGSTRSEACKNHCVSETGFDNLLKLIFRNMDSKTEKCDEPVQDNVLDRLVLNISNNCNLKCRYCYAGGGTYGGQKAFMNEETAFVTINKFCSIFDVIDKIQFFGGEPLMNPKLICFICDEFFKRHKDGRIRRLPQFSMVTNGTIVSKELFKMLRKYKIKATVSLDGPEIVNDYLRGKGTTQRIIQFIGELENYGIDYSFEGTFTSYHMRSNFSMNDLLDFFFHRFNQHEVHIPLISSTKEHFLSVDSLEASEIYKKAVEYSMENLKKGGSACLSFASRIANVFLDQKPIENYCPAGFGTLSVSVEGDVYPCFMFTGIQDFQFGNVFDGKFPNDQWTKKVLHVLSQKDKRNNEACLNCWASPFCSGCFGADYFISGKTLDKTGCDVMKAMVEGFLSKAINCIDETSEKKVLSLARIERG